MDNSAPSHSILDTLRTVEFRLGLKGYNVDEVDEYLEKAAVEAEQVQERLRSANEHLRQATERIAQLEAEGPRASDRGNVAQPASPVSGASSPTLTDETLQRTLVLAQKFVEQTKRESEAEAAQVLSRAEERARTLLAQAEERARQLSTEAEERLREEVARLEESRNRLAGDVEAMGRHLDEQRTKIRASLAEALQWVDERLQPGPQDAGRPAEPRATAPAARRPTGAPTAPRPEGAAHDAAVEEGARVQQAPAPAETAARPATVSASHTASERTQTPVGARLGVLHGGLFEGGQEGATAREERRLGD